MRSWRCSVKDERLCLIVNPHSAAGATARRLGALRRAADRHFQEWDLWCTESPGHASALAAEAVDKGFDVIVAVGGDGTANEVVNGLFEGGAPRKPGVVFSVIPAGTGSDLVKTLGMPLDLDAAMEVVGTAPDRAIDVSVIDLVGHDGEPVQRIGLNVTGFGMNGEVVKRANQSSKRFGGPATFLMATLRTFHRYQPGPVGVRWTDETGAEASWEGRLWSAFVANGQFCGGGMWIGRGGSMGDGLLDLTIVPELPLRSVLTGGHRLFSGTVDLVKNVSRHLASAVRAEALDDAPVLIDIDGEQPGILPITISVVPEGLLSRGQWPYLK